MYENKTIKRSVFPKTVEGVSIDMAVTSNCTVMYATVYVACVRKS